MSNKDEDEEYARQARERAQLSAIERLHGDPSDGQRDGAGEPSCDQGGTGGSDDEGRTGVPL